MPRVLERWSEPFPPSGGVTAIGVKNALGRPRMDVPTLLVRETVQNSWDAGQRTQTRPIKYRVDGWIMEGQRLDALRSFFADRDAPSLPLGDKLAQQELPVVVISDRGTTGLGGATRADVLTSQPSDFADFVRNVGQPPDKKRGGGTYGYGKAVLFLASGASTIIAYTRCVTETGSESRLIAIGLGDPFTITDGGVERRYTGRHWWGVRDEEAGVEPLTGDHADEVAQLIGMPGFDEGEHGTSIMIIGADFGETDLSAAVAEMGEAILWYCWPNMVPVDGEAPSMEFSLTAEGAPVPLSDPAKHPDLRGYVEAYRATTAGTPPQAVLATREEVIRAERPRQDLGRLGIVQYLRDQRLPDVALGRPFEGIPHHVALMRAPRLIVTYLAGPESPVPGVAWAGVFVAADAVDRAFAAAEPPSHDNWTPDILPRSHEKTFVNVALRNIREAVRLFTRPEASPDEGADVIPLAGIAAALGGLLASDTGPGTRTLPETPRRMVRERATAQGTGGGAGYGAGSGGGPGTSRVIRQRMPRVEVQDSMLVLDDLGPAVEVMFRVIPATSATRTILRAAPAVSVNDGSTLEREAPVGAERPRVLHWRVGDRMLTTEHLDVSGNAEVEGYVRVLVPPDTSIAVSILAEAVTEGEK